MSIAAAEDWEATAIIYGFDENDDDDDDCPLKNKAGKKQPPRVTTMLDNAGGLLRGCIHLEVPLDDFVFGRQMRPFDPQTPRYRFWTLVDDGKEGGGGLSKSKTTPKIKIKSEPPVEEQTVCLQFRLVFWCRPSSSGTDEDEEEQLYDRVEIKLLSPYPPSFPQDLKFHWWTWLGEQGNAMLHDEQLSYSVCNFIQHKAMDFFPRLWDDKNLVVFDDDGPAFYDLHTISTPTTVKRLLPLQRQYPNGSKELLHTTSTLSPTEQAFIVPLLLHWKQWLPMECPICFDTVPAHDAVIVSCDHGFCRSCLTTYLRIKAADVHSENSNNPFVCPLPKCRQGMKIKTCVKFFLTEDLQDKVRKWYKDVKNPPSFVLDQCLKRSCSGTVLRKEAVDSYLMSCEACQGRWCELCLQRAPKPVDTVATTVASKGKKNKKSNASEEDPHFTTMPSLCLAEECIAFCERYLSAGEEAQQTCRNKWPWIQHYAKARIHDESIHDWIKSNAQKCPGCKTGIERLEGCFHMSCACGTHFCYECGEEIFYPFYGTHHCWEREQRLQETYQAYEEAYRYQQDDEGGGGEMGGLFLGMLR